MLPLRGTPHRLHLRGTRSGAVRVGAEAGEPVISLSCEPAHVPRRIRDYLTREARRDPAEAVERYAPLLGQRPVRITLRDTRSRWGSC
ncbi:YgjP-like metallopeptidase domain-containing protein, partial [Methylobacterium mesophilicum]